ncbi:MAG: CDP-diacylglycerol--serine O-phosphatidyltransferase [Planctomycetota bacterium]|nr:CDP-diacylglycerol--serine O-phosphatidyltransferase [Planctomycetota bacterium]MDA1212830.1 CDP-diacylglycerol--serine O-phosphatidyltransferase [Planctomycetota bacterium]
MKKIIKAPKMFAVLPTMLTLANGACGFGSITIAAKVGPEGIDVQQTLFVASLLIFLGMVFDMFDGQAARWANSASEFGAELDSLCDAISFGVAPAFLMLQFSREFYHPRLLWVIALLFAMCAILRLARFNVETDEDDSHDYFSGLPSPAAAGTIAAFPIAARGLMNWTETGRMAYLAQWTDQFVMIMKIALPLLTFITAFLMVSRIRYPHVFNQWFRGVRTRKHVIQLLFAGAVIFVVRETALPLVLCFFTFASPVRAAWMEWIAPSFKRSNSGAGEL